MRRRTFLSGVAAAPLIAMAQERPAAPNFLFILFDKCRTDAIGAYGRRDVHTPNLDWLASTGVRFTNCYTPQALCGPARASILTGLYPHAHEAVPGALPREERRARRLLRLGVEPGLERGTPDRDAAEAQHPRRHLHHRHHRA